MRAQAGFILLPKNYMKTQFSTIFILLIVSAAAHAVEFKEQVISTQAQPAPVAQATQASPQTAATSAPAVGKPLTYKVAQPGAKKSGKKGMPQLPGMGGNNFMNGAGPTGTNWDSGTPGSSGQGTGATPGEFDLKGAGECGPAQDMWRAAGAVMSEGVIPSGQGYNINAPNWPKLVGSSNSLRCEFSPGKQSMCTSATAAAFCQHIADLSNSGQLNLTSRQIAFLNGPQVKAAINGNTYSVAYLFQQLGGASMQGTGGNIQSVLSQARTGDVLRIDRSNGTGHSTIFKEIKGNQFCYWTSNKSTNGVGVQCENISSLTHVAVSRFPSDIQNLPARIDQMSSPTSMGTFNHVRANKMGAGEVKWASSLECTNGPTIHQAANNNGTQPAVAQK
jgi:hypothetical protein